MVTVVLFVRLEAKPGKEAQIENFLRGGLPIVLGEPRCRLADFACPVHFTIPAKELTMNA